MLQLHIAYVLLIWGQKVKWLRPRLFNPSRKVLGSIPKVFSLPVIILEQDALTPITAS